MFVKQKLKNIFFLGLKELRTLCRDWVLLGTVIYVFSLGLYFTATSGTDGITNAVIAVVDEDDSQLSRRLRDSFLPPMFHLMPSISLPEIDQGMDKGEYTFVLVIPHYFERDVLADKCPVLQLNVDATRMSQAFTGSGYIQQIIQREIAEFVNRSQPEGKTLAAIIQRNRFNPNLSETWFKAVMEIVNNITLLAIILTGSALLRERERGTLEHLLVMPVTPFEIMVSKLWSMALVVLAAATFSVSVMLQEVLQIPVNGSILLFLAGVLLHLFAAASLGMVLATVAQSMPQIGILLILILLPMQILSGGTTPQESMPPGVQFLMQFAPTTHFVNFSQAILFRGAGPGAVLPAFLKLLLIGCGLFFIAWKRFQRAAA
jgi:ABC-2 type transport system permease protein